MIKHAAIIAILFSILTAPFAHGQRTFHIFGTSNWAPYFKTLGVEVGDFYYSCRGLKDSLPDGTYLFYSYDKRDSLKREYSREVISATYLDGKKNGVFKSVRYKYNKKKKMYQEAHITIINYVNGFYNGIMEEYLVENYELFTAYIMLYYCEFTDGEKNGLEILYNDGYPYEIQLFEKGVINKSLLKRKIIPD